MASRLAALRAGGAYHGVGDGTLRREERRAEAAAADLLAAAGAGAVAKTAIGVAGRPRRQWLRWLTPSTARRTSTMRP